MNLKRSIYLVSLAKKVILSTFFLILQAITHKKEDKTTEVAWCIFETHRNKSYSPNSWILLMSSKAQLNTLIALDQFCNVHILEHLFSTGLSKELWIQEKLFQLIQRVFDEAPRWICCVTAVKSRSITSYNSIRYFRKLFLAGFRSLITELLL